MSPAPSAEETLPPPQSVRILQDVFPQRPSTDNDFHEAQEAIPAVVTNNGDHRAISTDHQAATDGKLSSQSADQASSRNKLQDEETRTGIHGKEHDTHNGSGGLIFDPEKLDWKAHHPTSLGNDSASTIHDPEKLDRKAHHNTPLSNDSTSTIHDLEKQHRASTQTDHANRPSNESSRDLEKGETGSKEDNNINHTGNSGGPTHWENNVVGWDGPNDPHNPQNWKRSKKYTTTVFYATLTFCITFSSSIFSTATVVTAKMYGVSNEVMTLGTSLFVLVSTYIQL